MNDGSWNEVQSRFAADLLGIRRELRSTGGTTGAEPDRGRACPADGSREVERLEGLIKNSLTALDWGAQMMAMAGMPREPDGDSKQHRKYENSARREYELAKADLLASRARRS